MLVSNSLAYWHFFFWRIYVQISWSALYTRYSVLLAWDIAERERSQFWAHILMQNYIWQSMIVFIRWNLDCWNSFLAAYMILFLFQIPVLECDLYVIAVFGAIKTVPFTQNIIFVPSPLVRSSLHNATNLPTSLISRKTQTSVEAELMKRKQSLIHYLWKFLCR